MMSMLKAFCKLCGSAVKRTKRRREEVTEEDASNEFSHYRVVDKYYYKLLSNVSLRMPPSRVFRPVSIVSTLIGKLRFGCVD